MLPACLQVIVVMTMLIRVLTVWPALAGLAVTVAIIPLTMFLGNRLTAARKESVVAADQRVKLMTEVITGKVVTAAVTCTHTRPPQLAHGQQSTWCCQAAIPHTTHMFLTAGAYYHMLAFHFNTPTHMPGSAPTPFTHTQTHHGC